MSVLTAWSAQFEMGLPYAGRVEGAVDWRRDNLLRKEFTLSGKVVRARAYVTALGYYELQNQRREGRVQCSRPGVDDLSRADPLFHL